MKELSEQAKLFLTENLKRLPDAKNRAKADNASLKENLEYFSFKDSGFKCKSCGKQDKGAMQISSSTMTAIKYIVMSPPKKLFSFNLSDENKKELEIVSKLYLNDKLDKEYKLEGFF